MSDKLEARFAVPTAADHAGYRLRVSESDVDIGRVAALVERDHARRATGAAADLAAALDCGRGAPLADVADNLAFAPEIARLTEWRAQLLAVWLDVRLQTAPTADVLPVLERAARSDPLRWRPLSRCPTLRTST